MCVGRISNFNIANRYKLEKGQRLEVVSNGSDSDEGSGETKKKLNPITTYTVPGASNRNIS